MTDGNDIREKLAELEALIARDATAGEREAAGAASDRLQAKLTEPRGHDEDSIVCASKDVNV